ncbi:MAG TPA: protein kinase [Gemmatimonadales bacterium]|nr:protein kinase [Gemmatimonadales bacterium]
MANVPAALAVALCDRYALERELGRGGMATVYLARDLKHDRLIALKVLRPELADTLGAERFLREIRIAARLQHPNILPVHDSGDAAGHFWFTMPYVEGESLRARLTRERQLPLDHALRIAREVADALDYAHRHGVIHRDIKPENILLSDTHALVADFGVARAIAEADTAGEKLTETGFVIGTAHYMSPEQSAGARDLDARTDIYALGCVLYEMLAGEPPYSGATAQAILAKRLIEPVPSVATLRQVPASVERTTTRALARDPADRFATAAELARALESAPAAVPAAVSTPAERHPAAARRVAVAAGGLALVLLAGYVAGRRLISSREPASGEASAPTASAAVLPFTDLSPAGDQEYFSDGLTEELITALSQVPGLRVAARTSSFQFKGTNTDVRTIGRQLDVGAVLEGSVRRSGDRLRVSAQLVSAKDGYQLWSESYDRNVADVFAVQEDIARAIASALRVRLAPKADASLSSRPTGGVETYELYLKGRFAWNQRTDRSIPEAARYFEQATTRDPRFARAYAGLADAYILLPSYSGASPDTAWPKAKAAAARALALDSTLAEAYTSLAYGTMLYEWDWVQAEDLFKRALAADPSYANAHHWYADFLAGRGRLDEALREMRRAAQLDPLSRIIAAEVAWVLYTMHRDDEAMAELDRALRLDPNFSQNYMVRGFIQTHQGRYREAIASFRRAIDLGGTFELLSGALATAYVGSGHRDSALALLRDMERRSAKEYVPPFAFAIMYTALGRKTEAFEWLNRGIDRRDSFLPENVSDPLLDSLRGDPRFAEVARRMGIGPGR